jgi:hypothetical protein
MSSCDMIRKYGFPARPLLQNHFKTYCYENRQKIIVEIIIKKLKGCLPFESGNGNVQT